MSEYMWQEVRASDSNVVVPSDLHLPQESEPEKLSATFLGLTFPFPVCSGNCVESYICFQCHTLEKHEELGCITARFRPPWRHWRACMSLRSENAQDRIFAGLAHPVIRDVIGIRSTVPEKEEDEVVGLLQLILHKHLRPRDCRYHGADLRDACMVLGMLGTFSFHAVDAIGAFELRPDKMAGAFRTTSFSQAHQQQSPQSRKVCSHDKDRRRRLGR